MWSSGKGLQESWGSAEADGGMGCVGGGVAGPDFAYTQVIFEALDPSTSQRKRGYGDEGGFAVLICWSLDCTRNPQT